MQIEFWGVRGSIASPGADTASVGGNTSCVSVRCDKSEIILDAGTGLRGLGDSRLAELRGAPFEATLLLSHFHWDHIQGFPFFVPAYIPSTRLTIMGATNGVLSLEETLTHQMKAPHFPVRLDEMRASLALKDIRAGVPFAVGDATVRATRLNHPGGVHAYRIEHGGRSVVYATDTEHYECLDPVLVGLAQGADVLIYDAQYTPEEYPSRSVLRLGALDLRRGGGGRAPRGSGSSSSFTTTPVTTTPPWARSRSAPVASFRGRSPPAKGCASRSRLRARTRRAKRRGRSLEPERTESSPLDGVRGGLRSENPKGWNAVNPVSLAGVAESTLELRARVGTPAAMSSRLSLLVDLASRLGREVGFDALLGVAGERLAAALSCERATIWLIDATSHELVTRFAVLPEVPALRQPMGKGIAGYVARTGEPVRIDEASRDPRFDPSADRVTGFTTRSMLVVPLREDERAPVRGVVQLLNRYDGVFDPADEQYLVALASQLARALSLTTLRSEDAAVPGVTLRGPFNRIIGRSPELTRVYEQISLAAETDASVLLRGETGTGKGIFARAIHVNSTRQGGPFITVDCTTLPGQLVESELFGHERGAFTGADRKVPGRVELATRGTLFLDEIGDLPLDVQGKLLRFLQDRTFERVGGRTTLEADVRVVAATHRDLEAAVADGTFREDLYYRLRVVEMVLPPLRARGPDEIDSSRHTSPGCTRNATRGPSLASSPPLSLRFTRTHGPGMCASSSTGSSLPSYCRVTARFAPSISPDGSAETMVTAALSTRARTSPLRRLSLSRRRLGATPWHSWSSRAGIGPRRRGVWVSAATG